VVNAGGAGRIPAPCNYSGRFQPNLDRIRAKLSLSKWLIVLGIILVATGLLWPVLSKLGLGRLPGDIIVRREGFTFYFPLMTSLVISAVISFVIWFLRK
jgi:DUF2905 family protein